MGWHGDRIGHGSGQRHWSGHGDRRGCWNEFNSDNYDDEDWVCRWHGTSHGDVGGGYCVDSNVWSHDINGQWFHGADHEL